MDSGLVGLTFVGLGRHSPAFAMQLIRLPMGLRLWLSRYFFGRAVDSSLSLFLSLLLPYEEVTL